MKFGGPKAHCFPELMSERPGFDCGNSQPGRTSEPGSLEAGSYETRGRWRVRISRTLLSCSRITSRTCRWKRCLSLRSPSIPSSNSRGTDGKPSPRTERLSTAIWRRLNRTCAFQRQRGSLRLSARPKRRPERLSLTRRPQPASSSRIRAS
jgi:hypothetical protein